MLYYLQAIEAGLKLVCASGFVSVASYVGHKGGLEESDVVRAHGKQLPPSDWVVLCHKQKRTAHSETHVEEVSHGVI